MRCPPSKATREHLRAEERTEDAPPSVCSAYEGAREQRKIFFARFVPLSDHEPSSEAQGTEGRPTDRGWRHKCTVAHPFRRVSVSRCGRVLPCDRFEEFYSISAGGVGQNSATDTLLYPTSPHVFDVRFTQNGAEASVRVEEGGRTPAADTKVPGV